MKAYGIEEVYAAVKRKIREHQGDAALAQTALFPLRGRLEAWLADGGRLEEVESKTDLEDLAADFEREFGFWTAPERLEDGLPKRRSQRLTDRSRGSLWRLATYAFVLPVAARFRRLVFKQREPLEVETARAWLLEQEQRYSEPDAVRVAWTDETYRVSRPISDGPPSSEDEASLSRLAAFLEREFGEEVQEDDEVPFVLPDAFFEAVTDGFDPEAEVERLTGRDRTQALERLGLHVFGGRARVLREEERTPYVAVPVAPTGDGGRAEVQLVELNIGQLALLGSCVLDLEPYCGSASSTAWFVLCGLWPLGWSSLNASILSFPEVLHPGFAPAPIGFDVGFMGSGSRPQAAVPAILYDAIGPEVSPEDLAAHHREVRKVFGLGGRGRTMTGEQEALGMVALEVSQYDGLLLGERGFTARVLERWQARAPELGCDPASSFRSARAVGEAIARLERLVKETQERARQATGGATTVAQQPLFRRKIKTSSGRETDGLAEYGRAWLEAYPEEARRLKGRMSPRF